MVSLMLEYIFYWLNYVTEYYLSISPLQSKQISKFDC
jgi:hypothetical protein